MKASHRFLCEVCVEIAFAPKVGEGIVHSILTALQTQPGPVQYTKIRSAEHNNPTLLQFLGRITKNTENLLVQDLTVGAYS